MPDLLAIDPGNEVSGFVIIDMDTYKPDLSGIVSNRDLRERLFRGNFEDVAIEMISNQGMPVGKSVFDTVLHIGRFVEIASANGLYLPKLIYRREVQMNLCGTMKAKDANVIQALIDRFAPDTPNRGKGTKADPGWFYGFKSHVWQAYAVGVTALDTM